MVLMGRPHEPVLCIVVTSAEGQQAMTEAGGGEAVSSLGGTLLVLDAALLSLPHARRGRQF
jgi:hypothetical protein